MDSMYMVFLVTTKDMEEAGKISQKLVDEKLVACVNIVKEVRSLFWWQGKVDQAQEALMVIKTRKSHFAQIVDAVKSAHSYEVPEIIALPIIDGNQDYLKWIDESVK